LRRRAGDLFLGFFFGARIGPAIEARFDAARSRDLAPCRRRRPRAAAE
jgi:hypothetical protein